MEYEWTIFLQEEVQKQRKIPIPDDVKAAVGYDHELDGPCLYLNYERNANYIVLSRYPLREPNYQDVGRYQIHGIDEIQEPGGRIRIPDSLAEVVKTYYFEGEKVNYMAYQQMVERDNPTVFLLSNTQFLQLLPPEVQSSVSDDGEAGIQQSIMDIPAFLPPT